MNYKQLMLVDSHCHLDMLDFTQKNLATILQDAAQADVKFFLCPGVDIENFPNILRLAAAHKNIVASIGRHPTEKGEIPTIDKLLELGSDKLVMGVGETGLDYSRLGSEAEKILQQDLFRVHIRAAKELNKPLIIHSRDATEDIIKILRAERAEEIGGVFHCFADSLEAAATAIELNFYISLSGIVTFKNAERLRTVAKTIPLEKMLLETDAPYLAPVPMRGKSNEPAYLRYIAEFVAGLREISYENLAMQTTENFFTLFKGARV
jgi:TatD DNase family protein